MGDVTAFTNCRGDEARNARVLRFCTIAARWNSRGHRKTSEPHALEAVMNLRWANRISTRVRSSRDRKKAFVLH